MGQTPKRNYDRYTLEFKVQAVKLANLPGVMARDIADGLGIHPVMLYRWQMEHRNGELKANKSMKKSKPSPKRRLDQIDPSAKKEAELRKAEKRIKKLESTASATGHQWAGDFTYLRTKGGWFYLAVIIDLYSRKVVGWSFSSKRNSELTKSALKMALSREPVKPDCIFHSDQGIEYAAHEYREVLMAAGLRRSMNSKGNPIDNATMESFFHTLKAELVSRRTYESHIGAVARIVEYIEFYNRERLHSSLNFQSPVNYEMLST